MSDAELHHFCDTSEYPAIKKMRLKDEEFLEGGKVAALREHIGKCQKEGKRMLLFSQVSACDARPSGQINRAGCKADSRSLS